MATFENKWSTSIEPKRKDRWTMGISGIDAFLCRTSARPSMTLDEYVIDYVNTKRYYSGKAEWQQITVTLTEAINPSAAAQVYTWMLLHQNTQNGVAGYKGEYAKDVTLTLYGPDETVVEKWTLKNTFLSGDINFGDLDYSTAEPIEVSITLRYDYAELETAAVL